MKMYDGYRDPVRDLLLAWAIALVIGCIVNFWPLAFVMWMWPAHGPSNGFLGIGQ